MAIHTAATCGIKSQWEFSFQCYWINPRLVMPSLSLPKWLTRMSLWWHPIKKWRENIKEKGTKLARSIKIPIRKPLLHFGGVRCCSILQKDDQRFHDGTGESILTTLNKNKGCFFFSGHGVKTHIFFILSRNVIFAKEQEPATQVLDFLQPLPISLHSWSTFLIANFFAIFPNNFSVLHHA